MWLAIKDVKQRDVAPFHQQMAAQVYEYYFRNYAVHFSSEGMSTAFATIPQVLNPHPQAGGHARLTGPRPGLQLAVLWFFAWVMLRLALPRHRPQPPQVCPLRLVPCLTVSLLLFIACAMPRLGCQAPRWGVGISASAVLSTFSLVFFVHVFACAMPRLAFLPSRWVLVTQMACQAFLLSLLSACALPVALIQPELSEFM